MSGETEGAPDQLGCAEESAAEEDLRGDLALASRTRGQ
jgi:hypothetical protein